jgi:SAM-dependent methyltransferase
MNERSFGGYWQRVGDTYSGQRASNWLSVGDTIAYVEGQDNQIKALLPVLLSERSIAVDFGCGAGKLLAQMQNWVRPTLLVGVDVSRSMLYEASRLLRASSTDSSNCLLLASPLEICPLPNDFADVSILKMVLHHVPDPATALCEVARITRPGGHLLLMTVGQLYQINLFPELRAQPDDPLGRFDLDTLERLVLAAGLFPLNIYKNRFRFWFRSLRDYLIFMDGIGAISKLFGYKQQCGLTVLLSKLDTVMRNAQIGPVLGEYITMDCIKDPSWMGALPASKGEISYAANRPSQGCHEGL